MNGKTLESQEYRFLQNLGYSFHLVFQKKFLSKVSCLQNSYPFGSSTFRIMISLISKFRYDRHIVKKRLSLLITITPSAMGLNVQRTEDAFVLQVEMVLEWIFVVLLSIAIGIRIIKVHRCL